MIPKTIHYCWFGENPLPKSANKCISSWKTFFPDYEIKEWNESNFDVHIIPYTSEAYNAGKYAFVSDYARYWILYNYGGLYFDTDVEVINSMRDILGTGPFMGIQDEEYAVSKHRITVNPGLGLAANKGNIFYKEMLDNYSTLHFIKEDGSLNTKTIVEYTTEKLITYGLEANNTIQCIEGIYIYPKDFFNPMEMKTGKIIKTENTRSIHHYDASWLDKKGRFHGKIYQFFVRLLGEKYAEFIRSVIGKKAGNY